MLSIIRSRRYARHASPPPLGTAPEFRRIFQVLGPDYHSIKNQDVRPIDFNHVIGFPFDAGGWNNIKMGFEIALGITWIHNRTLVLPPPKKLYLIDGSTGFETIFDHETMRRVFSVVTAKEYFGFDIEYQQYLSYFRRQTGISKRYIPKIAVTTSKTHRSSTRLLNSSERHLDVNAILRKHAHARVWYLDVDGHKTSDNRRNLAWADDFFRHDSELVSLRLALYNGLRYTQDIIDATVASAIESKLPSPGRFNAAHYRRGDFQFNTDQRNITAVDHYTSFFKIEGISNRIPVLLLTNMGEDPHVFANVRRKFDVRPPQFPKSVSDKYAPFVSSILPVAAKRFIGTRLSTYTSNIMMLRGWAHLHFHSLIDATPRLMSKESGVDGMNGKWSCPGKCFHVVLIIFTRPIIFLYF